MNGAQTQSDNDGAVNGKNLEAEDENAAVVIDTSDEEDNQPRTRRSGRRQRRSHSSPSDDEVDVDMKQVEEQEIDDQVV